MDHPTLPSSACLPPVRKAGFTLVELLVVISIMALLAGLTLAAAMALGVGSKRNKSASILQTVRQAVELSRANTGSAPTPVEHPLAGSAAYPSRPRLEFVRFVSHAAVARTVSVPAGSPGEQIALVGVDPGDVPSGAADRVLMADDRFADTQVPLLYGLARGSIGVYAARTVDVTRFRRIPRPATGAIIADPDDRRIFPDAVHLVAPTEGPDANADAIAYVFASAGTMAELSRQKALNTPPNDDAAQRLAWGRVWSSVGLSAAGQERWKAGMLNDPERTPPSTPSWKPYQLRGASIVDGWGREILASVDANGSLTLMSAGRDGVFAIDPGEDGDFATPAWADGPAAGDRDGRTDNIVSSESGRK